MARDSTKDALMKFMEKAHKKSQPKKPRKKNSKPEQEFVKNELLPWCKSVGMSVHIVESKAVYSAAAGRYLHSQTSESLPDVIGNLRSMSVWIEAKAPGRKSTLKEHQRAFLIKKAMEGCFAICTDSVAFADYMLKKFKQLDPIQRVEFLVDHLRGRPMLIQDEDMPLFED